MNENEINSMEFGVCAKQYDLCRVNTDYDKATSNNKIQNMFIFSSPMHYKSKVDTKNNSTLYFYQYLLTGWLNKYEYVVK